MHSIIDHLSFPMHKPIAIDDCNMFVGRSMRKINNAEWNTILHPDDKWQVFMTFDRRANDDGDEDENKMHNRVESFEPNTTLRDFVKRISSGPCYGYFEGLDLQSEENNVYKLVWGT
jgi:hypothetical protein